MVSFDAIKAVALKPIQAQNGAVLVVELPHAPAYLQLSTYLQNAHMPIAMEAKSATFDMASGHPIATHSISFSS